MTINKHLYFASSFAAGAILCLLLISHADSEREEDEQHCRFGAPHSSLEKVSVPAHMDLSFSVGWEGGAWFVASPTNRMCSALHEGAARRSLSFTLHVSEDGFPRTLALSADGADNAFPSLIASPPAWMFSREWNAVRLTVRGVGEADEAATVRFGPNPIYIILR